MFCPECDLPNAERLSYGLLAGDVCTYVPYRLVEGVIGMGGGCHDRRELIATATVESIHC
jgi:hypothetical protein